MSVSTDARERLVLPEKGLPWSELERELEDAKKNDVDWRGGRSPAFVHYGGDDVLEVAKRAFLMYFSENGLGPRAFKSLAKFEAEIVDWGLGLLHGGANARGALTTGGTESIFLAVKAARDRFVARGGEGAGTRPTIVMARSAHPAFDKAAHFLGLEPIRTPLRADFLADAAAIDAAIDERTAMVVASAPAYPHGVMDPIADVAGVAARKGRWMHVDACVGGYIAPFAAMLGARIPPFDFAVPGVTSISADLHKYGYAAKGVSTLYFAEAADFAHMGYAVDCWPRGQYFTNTLVGTRPGGSIASAWAVMKTLGRDGYLEITRRVLAMREAYQRGVESLGFRTLGDPQLSILAYGSTRHDMVAVGKSMNERGWLTSFLRDPDGIHLMLNLTHEPVVGRYLDDLAQAASDAMRAGASGEAVRPVY